MTIEEFNKKRWGARMKALCKPMTMRYNPYVADVVSVSFDQALIGVMENPESEDEEVRWLRCENCEIVKPEKEER